MTKRNISIASKNLFEKTTLEYIQRHSLLEHNDKTNVLVALSGGADSVALLAVLVALGYNCIGVHCNFHLRGEESMRDMRHACDICEILGVKILIKDFDVASRMSDTGESVEMACRELRYIWFNELADTRQAQAIAVGHHREDQAETFMLNLLRGTGIAGLSGMKARNGKIIRPLLERSRSEIETYLDQSGLTYIFDSSNASDVHRRNRLRNKLFPKIEELFPGALDNILQTVANINSAREIYDEAIAKKSGLYRISDEEIDLSAMLAHERCAPTLLFEILRPYGFNATQARNIIDSAANSGLKFTSNKTVAELDHGHIYLRQQSDISAIENNSITVSLDCDIEFPIKIKISSHDISEFANESFSNNAAYFDTSILDGSPTFKLRHYRQGDRMIPFGMKKSKLVSDLFANVKYTAEQKRQTWILTRNDQIIWIPELRASALFSIGKDSQRYIKLCLS